MGNLNLGAQSSDAPLTGSAILDGSINLSELAQSLRNYLVPIGAILPYAGTGSAPSGFVYCDGALHDVAGTCSTCGLEHTVLASALSNAYGGVSGVSFRVPDLRGRVPLGVGAGVGGGGSGTTGSNPSGTALTSRVRGAWGGAETHLLSGPESGIQAHSTVSAGSHAHTLDSAGAHAHGGSTSSNGDHQHNYTASYDTNGSAGVTAGGSVIRFNIYVLSGATTTNGAHTHSISTDTQGSHTHTVNSSGSHSHSVSAASATNSHNNTQPFVAVNYIIKAI